MKTIIVRHIDGEQSAIKGVSFIIHNDAAYVKDDKGTMIAIFPMIALQGIVYEENIVSEYADDVKS